LPPILADSPFTTGRRRHAAGPRCRSGDDCRFDLRAHDRHIYTPAALAISTSPRRRLRGATLTHSSSDEITGMTTRVRHAGLSDDHLRRYHVHRECRMMPIRRFGFGLNDSAVVSLT